MGPANDVKDRAVYMAFNTIIHGQALEIRQLPSVKRFVHKNNHRTQVSQLLKKYGETAICETLQRLLGGRVFESTLNAESRFPGLFEVSHAQSVERAISEAAAAEGHARAVEEALNSADQHGLPHEDDSECNKKSTDLPQTTATTTLIGSSMEQQSTPLQTRVPSLFPLEFRFTTAYKILLKTQEVLELACFRFAEKAMPEILDKRAWHSPESVELNKWAYEFSKRLVKFEKMPAGVLPPSRPLNELFSSIVQIRHHAVHRIPVTARELEQFMADGEALVQLLQDHAAIAVMSRAKNRVNKAAAELENRKNLLEARLGTVLQDLADGRAQLDRVEAEEIAATQQRDKENQLLIDSHLLETIWLEEGAIGEGFLATHDPAENTVPGFYGLWQWLFPRIDSYFLPFGTTLSSATDRP